MDTVKRGYYGLVERPKFEDAVDASKTALRIPVPDRKYKRQIFSLYRERNSSKTSVSRLASSWTDTSIA